MDCSPPRLLCPWDSPSKNTGVGCHLIQGFLVGGIVASILVGEAEPFPSSGRGHVRWCFGVCLWAYYHLRQPVFWWGGLCSGIACSLMWGIQHWNAGSWVKPDFCVKIETSGRVHVNYDSLGLYILRQSSIWTLALLYQRLRSDCWAWTQDPENLCHGQKEERGKKLRNKQNPRWMIKTKTNKEKGKKSKKTNK